MGILDRQRFQQQDDYAFDLKFTSTTAGKQTVTKFGGDGHCSFNVCYHGG